jgi:hypothetical protein
MRGQDTVAEPSSPRSQRSSTQVRSPDDVERAMALRDVMEHVVETDKTPPERKKSRTGRAMVIAVCVLLLGASAYSWSAKPEWIWGPSGEPVSPVIDRASARMSMAIIAQRLNDMRAQTGEYPVGLEEIGEAGNGIEYSLVEDTVYVLRAHSAGDSIVYRSNQPLDEFLGRVPDLLSRAGR